MTTITNAAAPKMTLKLALEENAKLRTKCNELEQKNSDLTSLNAVLRAKAYPEHSTNSAKPKLRSVVSSKPFELSDLGQRRKALSMYYGAQTRIDREGNIEMYSKKRAAWCIVPADHNIPNQA